MTTIVAIMLATAVKTLNGTASIVLGLGISIKLDMFKHVTASPSKP